MKNARSTVRDIISKDYWRDLFSAMPHNTHNKRFIAFVRKGDNLLKCEEDNFLLLRGRNSKQC